MTNDQMHELARVGAQARLQAIEGERSAILQAFPNLGSTPTGASTNGAAVPRTARRRGGMSPSQRKAVSERMKAYWAKRRGERAGEARVDGASGTASATTKQPAKRKSGMSAEARRAHGERMRAYWAAKRAKKESGSAKRAGRKTGRKK